MNQAALTPAQLAAQAAVQAAILRASSADQSKIRGARTPFFGPGDHVALVSATDVQIQDGTTRVWVRSVITGSDRDIKLPLEVVTLYDLTAPARYTGSPSGAALFASLLVALGCENTQPALAKLMGDVLVERRKDQILRGLAYRMSCSYARKESKEHAVGADGRQYRIAGHTADGKAVLDYAKERFVYLSPSPLDEEQTDAQVAESRKWLDEHFPVKDWDAASADAAARDAGAHVSSQDATPTPTPTQPTPSRFRLPGT